MILLLRTDRPEAELYLHDGENIVDQEIWHAHRQLSVQLLAKIEDILQRNDLDKYSLSAVVAFKGPGSFTGLRIGLSVANALADGLSISVVSTMGDDWIAQGVGRINDGENETVALPEYGGEANITKPRK